MKTRLTLFMITLFLSVNLFADDDKKEKSTNGYQITDVKVLPVTGIKNQYRSGTCWSFSGLSFLESELIRLGKPEADLSEMFIIWHTYREKAVKYVRMHGKLNFSAGGAFHDVTHVIQKYGIVPESAYSGLNYGEEKHVHGEMDKVLSEQVKAVVQNKNRKLSTAWYEAYMATLNAYLDEVPDKFLVQGKEYTPLTYRSDYLGLNMDDYIEIGSYTHHPFYSRFIIEIPDNWMWGEVYNVPIDEMEAIIDYSLDNGFTVAWAADVSEKGFKSANKGVAVVPDVDVEEMSDAEIARWETLNDKEKEAQMYRLDKPGSEKEITQEMRQIAFDNYQTTDDHGMQIMGIGSDQNGTTYYKVKNSWGDYNKLAGYFYASKPYVRYKTTCIMVHKEGIPKDIRKKLNIK